MVKLKVERGYEIANQDACVLGVHLTKSTIHHRVFHR
jgi:hypothetical protein